MALSGGDTGKTFQSTPSAWRETDTTLDRLSCNDHFNPLPPHGGRQRVLHNYSFTESISIHSLRMEGDSEMILFQIRRFSFQSTPSAWRETLHLCNVRCGIRISIHSLRMEGDLMVSGRDWSTGKFQSTPSAWRETCKPADAPYNKPISIHSLRMEGDAVHQTGNLPYRFQSTPSAWRETLRYYRIDLNTEFQSTPSAWRETAKLHRKAFFISPILVQSCKKGCKRLHSAPEKMVFFEKREKNLVRNLQHLSVRL